MTLHRQVREIGVLLRAAHLPRMAQLVKSQKPPQPLLVGFNCARGVVAGLQFLSIPLDQTRRTGANRWRAWWRVRRPMAWRKLGTGAAPLARTRS